MELKQIINDIYPVSDETIATIEALVEPRHVGVRQNIIEQGKISRELFFIKSGVLRNYALHDGKEDTRWFAMDGDLIASMYSFAQGLPSIATVETLTEVEMLVMPLEEARRLVDTCGEWARWAAHYLIDGLYVLERRYTFLGTGDARTRYSNLLKMRSYRFLEQVPLQYIASYLNITPQTLSNVRRELARSGSKR